MSEAVSWKQFASAEPDLASYGQARLSDDIAYLATVRPDGSPRVHPVGAAFIEGHLLVFMEPTSPKGHDLLRDPRYTLHSSVKSDCAEFVCRGTAQPVTGTLRQEFGKKDARTLDRYVLYEFFVEEALRTVYVEKRPHRTRWTVVAGTTRSRGLPTL